MSQAKEQPAAFDDVIARPGFEVALRGYDKRQVEQYVARVDAEISALIAERNRMLTQLHEMGGQLQKQQAELNDLRRRPPTIERASFRHLGPMVDQILALSEKQGEAIVSTAVERAGQHQAKADKALIEAREQADGVRAEGEAAREAAAQEATQITAQATQQLEQAKAEAEALMEASRAQVQQEVEAVQSQTQQELARQSAIHQQQLAVVLHEIEGRQKIAAQLRTEVDTAQQRLVQTRHDAAVAERDLGQLQQQLGEATQQLDTQLSRLDNAKQAAESAERHAIDVRARVQREAERVANMAAAAVMAAAARGAEPTGEYPQVQLQPGGNHAAHAAPLEEEAPRQANGHGHAIPIQRDLQREPQQREPQPEAKETEAPAED